MVESTAEPLMEHRRPDVERVVHAHDGVRDGCRCMAVHPARHGSRRNPDASREDERALVERSRARAALAYAGGAGTTT